MSVVDTTVPALTPEQDWDLTLGFLEAMRPRNATLFLGRNVHTALIDAAHKVGREVPKWVRQQKRIPN